MYSGTFSLVQIFVYLAKNPTECIFVQFNFACQSYNTMPLQLTYGLEHSMVISLQFMSLFSFCFNRTTDQLQESLSRLLKDLAVPIRASPRIVRSKFTQNFLIVRILVVFVFACRTGMRKFTAIQYNRML